MSVLNLYRQIAGRTGVSLTTVTAPTYGDVQDVVRQAVEQLLSMPIKNGVLEPFKAKTDIGVSGAPSKFMDTVVTNACNDEWLCSFSIPTGATAYKADAVAARAKNDVFATAIGAFALDAEAFNGLRAINIYKALNVASPKVTVYTEHAIKPLDSPWYYVILPSIVVWNSGEEIRLEAEFKDSYASAKAGSTVNLYIVPLPTVKLIPRELSVYQI